MSGSPSANGRLALHYLQSERVPVVPVNPLNKAPFVKGGYKTATKSHTQVLAWWEKWPGALVGMPTGRITGFCVLDVDPGGESAFGDLLSKLGADYPEDLTPVVVRTPSGGVHLYFTCFEGASFQSRSSDIAVKIDTKGEGGSIILPGNVLPDGRAYEMVGPRKSIYDAAEIPRRLLYLGTFNAKEREYIRGRLHLQERLRQVNPNQWRAEVEADRTKEAARVIERCGCHDDEVGMRRQALYDLQTVAEEYASLQDGRRNKLFSLTCRVARYVAHRMLTEAEVTAALVHAAQVNGALTKYGINWAKASIRRALVSGQKDRLPPLARMFRTEGVRE